MLHKTLGVPLFQEQAMRIAIEAAKFTSEEANGLRRSMATFRNVGTIGKFEDKMIGNMMARGYDPEFARSCFDQIKGFGSYGFPESHAASFAQLVYISSWLKHYHPDALLLRPAQFAADGLLRPGADRRRCPQATASRCARSMCPTALRRIRWRRATGSIAPCDSASARSTGFSWVDADEERLKHIQSSFRNCASASIPGARERDGSLGGGSLDELHGRSSLSHRPGNDNVERATTDWADRIVAARTRRALHLAGRVRPRHRACRSAR